MHALPHLNGLHEDTDTFCRAVYLDQSYVVYYGSTDRERYQYRADAIYRPKINFVREALALDGYALSQFSYADIGSGSGYLVAALLDAGIDRYCGIDVSPHQVAYANQMVAGNRSRLIGLADTTTVVREIDVVVSMIGVLEHLQGPRNLLQALRGTTKVIYLFYVCRCLVCASSWKWSFRTLPAPSRQ